jgi:hypothetical protein
MTRCIANILVTNLAGCASPATDPGIYGHLPVGFYTSIRARGFDRAGNLVTKRKWQRTPSTNIKLSFSVEYKVTILHVQVGMTDATTFDPYQNFGALWPWYVYDRFAERLPVSGQ